MQKDSDAKNSNGRPASGSTNTKLFKRTGNTAKTIAKGPGSKWSDFSDFDEVQNAISGGTNHPGQNKAMNKGNVKGAQIMCYLLARAI